jgi:DNA topoisomerase-3
MKVIVAEKPSVASDIARVVKATQKCNGYYEGNGYQVTWCLGHLCTLKDPEDYSSGLKAWKMDTLPIIPERFGYKIIGDKQQQFDIVKGLLNSQNTDTIIEATDAEREGELIFRLVMAVAGCKNRNVYRLWINSLEEDAIVEGLRTMKPYSEYDNLFYAAACRQRADWLVGINLTRYYSLAYNDKISCGRVQTPVLGFVVDRDREIESFIPKDYYVVTADMGNFKLSMNVDTQQEADLVLRDCYKKPCVIQKVEKKEHKKSAPHLYDLTTLQREANRFFGMSASDTLDTAENLYLKKMLTYPRTDSRYITFNDKEPTVRILRKLIDSGFYHETALRNHNGQFNYDVIVNDAEVSDHTALLPTARVNPDSFNELNEKEKDILSLVCYRLLEAVSEPYEFISVKITATIGGHEFTASGKEDVREGYKCIERAYRELIDKPEKEPVSLPSVNENDAYQVFDMTTKAAKTQPPKRYTEDSLLSAMETCGKNLSDDELKLAMKERGLGTPATRASIIDNLIKKGFIDRTKGKLISTSKGRIFISKVVPLLRDPAMTAQWEKAIAEIRNGNVNPNAFMNGINKFVNGFFDYVRNKPIDDPEAFRRDRIVGKCPLCKQNGISSDVYEMSKSYSCENKECKFTLWKNIQKNGTKKISKAQAKKMLSTGKSDLIKGLISKDGTKEFSAYLILHENGNITFEFPKNKSGGG